MVEPAAVGPVRADAGAACGVDPARAAPEATDLAGQTWVPERVLDAYGDVAEAGEVAGVDGADLADGARDRAAGRACRPGFMPVPNARWR